MRNEVRTAVLGGGNLEKEEIPVIRLDRYRLPFWPGPGWKEGMAVGQVLILAGLFLYSGPLLRLIDPTAAGLDPGIVTALLLTVLVVDAFVVSAWLLVRLVRNTLTEFYEWDEKQEDIKKGITSCLEAKIIFISFWGLVVLFCALFLVLL